MKTHHRTVIQSGLLKRLCGGFNSASRRLSLIFLIIVATGAQAARTPESAVTPNGGSYGSILTRIKQGPIGLLFLGDSITAGWPAVNNPTWAKFEPYKPADFGVSGIDTSGLLWGITDFGELNGIDPKVVVIMIGTNNIGHNPDEKPEWAAAGIKKIVDTVQEKLPHAKVLLLGILPRAETKEQGGILAVAKVPQINAILKGFEDGKNITFLDLTDKFVDSQGNLLRELTFDGLHPNAKGYDVWFEAMWPTLEKMLK
jgi:beta-glucosidase